MRKMIILLAISLLLSSCKFEAVDSNEPNATTEKVKEVRSEPYLIQYLPSEESPNVARIIALEGKTSSDRIYYSEKMCQTYDLSGYGDCLWMALQKISDRYVIKGFVPINYTLERSSPTKEVWVIIEPKSK